MPRFLQLKSAAERPVVRLAVASLAVFAVSAAICLAVFFATLHSEKLADSRAFLLNADDLTSQVVIAYGEHARDLVVVAVRTARAIENNGALPPRATYARFAEGQSRTNPNRNFAGLSLFVNLTDAQRAGFEAGLTRENGVKKNLYPPTGGAEQPRLPPAPWYLSNVYTAAGPEAALGFSKVRPGWTWSAHPLFRDVAFRMTRGGRAIASPPTALPNSIVGLQSMPFFAFQVPVAVMPELLERWQPGSTAAAAAGRPLPLLYCGANVSCAPDIPRSFNTSDPRVLFVSTMQPLSVPLYGAMPQQLSMPPRALPLCIPASIQPTGADTYDDGLWSNSSIAAAPGASSCPSVQRQFLTAQAPLRVASKTLLFAGAISGTFYADRIAVMILQRFSSQDFVLAVEDITALPGAEFIPVSLTHDAPVSASPSLGWQALMRATNGTANAALALGNTSFAGTLLRVQTSTGVAVLEQSAASPVLWRYRGVGAAAEEDARKGSHPPVDGLPFGGGAFLFATDGTKIATMPTNGSDASACTDFRSTNGEPLRVCPPLLTPDQYARAVKGARFEHSFVTPIGDRLWHIRVSSSPGVKSTRVASRYTLIGGIVTACLLALLTLGALVTRNQRVAAASAQAAQRAHEMTTSYAVHEIRNPLHAVSASASLLGETLQELDDFSGSLGDARTALRKDRAAAALAAIEALQAEARLQQSAGTGGAEGAAGRGVATGSPAEVAAAAAATPERRVDTTSGSPEAPAELTAAERALLAEVGARNAALEAADELLAGAERMMTALQGELSTAVSQLRDDAATIEASTESLHRTVNDFTALQRLRTGSFELRPAVTSLRPAIVRAVEAALPMSRVPVIVWIQPATPTHAYLDALRLGQCILNACSNAAKHARRDMRVAVWTIGATAAAEAAAARHAPAAAAATQHAAADAGSGSAGGDRRSVLQRSNSGGSGGGPTRNLLRPAGSSSDSGAGDATAAAPETRSRPRGASAAADTTWCFDVITSLPHEAWHDGKAPSLPLILETLGLQSLPRHSALQHTVPAVDHSASAALSGGERDGSVNGDDGGSMSTTTRQHGAASRWQRARRRLQRLRGVEAVGSDASPAVGGAARFPLSLFEQDGFSLDWLVVDISDSGGSGLQGRTGRGLFEPFVQGRVGVADASGPAGIQGDGVSAPPSSTSEPAAGHRGPLSWLRRMRSSQPEHAQQRTSSAPDAPAPANADALPARPLADATALRVSIQDPAGQAGPGSGAPLPVPDENTLVHVPQGFAGADGTHSLSAEQRATGAVGDAAADPPADAATEPIADAAVMAPSAAARKGSGLGLALTASLIERMGGHVALAELPDGRTHSIIVLPCPVRQDVACADAADACACACRASSGGDVVGTDVAAAGRAMSRLWRCKPVGPATSIQSPASAAAAAAAAASSSPPAPPVGSDASSTGNAEATPAALALGSAESPAFGLLPEVAQAGSGAAGAAMTAQRLAQLRAAAGAGQTAGGRHAIAPPLVEGRTGDGIVDGGGAAAERAAAPGSQLQRLPGLRALVVDDDPVNRRLAARMLGRLGCTCTLLEDGDQVAAALERKGQLAPQTQTQTQTQTQPAVAPSTAGTAETRGYDLCLMDQIMARTTGSDVAAQLRARGCTLPIFAMTASASQHDARRHTAAGMSEHIVAKPFSMASLQRALDITRAALQGAARGDSGHPTPASGAVVPQASPSGGRAANDGDAVTSGVEKPL